MTEPTRISQTNATDYLTLVYNRRSGIYFTPFTLTISGTVRWTTSSGARSVGIWSVPYNVAPGEPQAGASSNSTNIMGFNNVSSGTKRTVTRYITSYECFTGCGGSAEQANVKASLNLNSKYWYRIYPYDGSVTASAASGSLGGAKTVTFTTPKCSWPTYYNGTNSYNGMKTGSLWPDVLVTYTTDGSEPADPTYVTHNVRATYNGYNQTTSAALNLAANQTYRVKVRLAVDNGYSDRQDVEYSKVNSFTYDTYAPPAASPAAGTYYNTQDVSLSSSGGYDIYYTLDGTEPTKSAGTKYGQPIRLTKSTKIRARQYSGDKTVGSVTDFNYIINLPGVKANPGAGAVAKGAKVALSLTASDAAHTDLLYTQNDALPYDQWTPYTAPIEITKDTTLYAVARDKISGRCGEIASFAYKYSELGYTLNDLAFWNGSTKIAPDAELSALAGKTVNAKANITKIIPSIQGWLVTALYDPSGHAQVKLDRLDQLSGTATGDVVGKAITLPTDTTGYVLKTFVVYDFAQLRPVGNIVQLGEREE